MPEQSKKIGTVLRADDLEVGMFVTIHEGRTILTSQISTAFGSVVHQFGVAAGDYKGIPLAVDAVNLPYALLTSLVDSRLRVFDLREVDLMRVDSRYVDVFLNGLPAAMGSKAPEVTVKGQSNEEVASE